MRIFGVNNVLEIGKQRVAIAQNSQDLTKQASQIEQNGVGTAKGRKATIGILQVGYKFVEGVPLFNPLLPFFKQCIDSI